MQARCRQSLLHSRTLSPLPAAAVYIEPTRPRANNGSHNGCITIVPPVTQIFLYAEELQLAEEKKRRPSCIQKMITD